MSTERVTAPVEVTVTVPGDLAAEMRAGRTEVDEHEAIAAWDANPYTERVWLLLAAAVKRAPRPIEVGDRVDLAVEAQKLDPLPTVVVIDRDEAGIAFPDGSHDWYPLSQLTRVDPDREEAPQ